MKNEIEEYSSFKEKTEDWLEHHPFLENIYYAVTVRLKWKLDRFFARKYPIKKEHRQIGLTNKDRPLKRFDYFEAYSVLPWVIYPVLVKFRNNKYAMGYPANLNSMEEWHEILDKMIYAFQELIYDDWHWSDDGIERDRRIKEGLNLFSEYFTALWD